MARWPDKTALQRFWSHVDKTPGHGPAGDCWIWTGSRSRQGYGRFIDPATAEHRKAHNAHRWIYEQTNGSVGSNDVCHHCDYPPCVRPNHLFSGTTRDNVLDAVRKGRLNNFHNGEHHYKAKLTAADVALILASNERGTVLALRFRVTRNTISAVRRRKTWRSP